MEQMAEKSNQEQEAWELFEKIDRMRREAFSDSEALLAEHRKEIYRCIKICVHLQRIAQYQGLEPLLLEGKQLEQGSSLYAELLSYGIGTFGTIGFENITGRMMERFGRKTAEGAYEKYMFYLCTRFLEMIGQGEPPRFIKQFFRSCVPAEERGALLQYMDNQTA